MASSLLFQNLAINLLRRALHITMCPRWKILLEIRKFSRQEPPLMMLIITKKKKEKTGETCQVYVLILALVSELELARGTMTEASV